MSESLPDSPNLDWLRREAKRRLRELKQSDPGARLADAQYAVAKSYGFSSWRALKAHIDSLTVDGQIIEAARGGDADRLASLLDRYPEKLHIRAKPYDATLLHLAARSLPAVDLLLKRGLDPNARENGDNTYAMHWAAAEGHLDVVRRLADAGGDVIGDGADHGMTVLGWATCFDLHEDVARFLLGRGARHHLFSAIAMNLADEVRRIVAADPDAVHRRLPKSDDDRTPLHFAVMKDRPDMVSLLLALGADPLAVDSAGFPAPMYSTNPEVDRRLMETIRDDPNAESLVLIAALALADWETASRFLRNDSGALAVMAKRGDARAVQWLLAHGVDPNERFGHWDASVTPLHLAAAQGHADVVRLLLDAGADPKIRDSKHDGDAIGWAEHGSMPQKPNWREIVQIIESHFKNRENHST
jgi:ankyrin repeat protein